MEESADVIVLSSEGEKEGDNDIVLLSDDVQSLSDDVQSEDDNDNKKSILFPVSPAKKIFTPTKRLRSRSSPTSEDSEAEDSEADGFSDEQR